MPRYFFNIENGSYDPDIEGVILADAADVRVQAAQMAGEMLRDGSARLWETGEWRLGVKNEAGETIFVLSLFVREGSSLAR